MVNDKIALDTNIVIDLLNNKHTVISLLNNLKVPINSCSNPGLLVLWRMMAIFRKTIFII